MKSKVARFTVLAVVLAVLASAAPSVASQTPSKTADDQTLEQREIDLAQLREIVAQPDVAEVIARQGFTTDEVNERLAQLTPEDIHTLSTQLDELQAAGAGVPTYVWILIAVALGVWILTAL